jgi:cytoskeletal protein CcmA (bactofilin family)
MWTLQPATSSQINLDLSFSSLVAGNSTSPAALLAPTQPIDFLTVPGGSGLRLANNVSAVEIAVANGATLDLNNAYLSVGMITVDGTLTGAGTIYGDVIVDGGGTLDLSQGPEILGTLTNNGGTIICPTGNTWYGNQCAPYTWTGASSTDWTNTENWQGGVLPPSGADVDIPNVTNEPSILYGYPNDGNGGVTLGTVTIADGALFTNSAILDGGTFNGAVRNTSYIQGGTFNGSVTNNGIIHGGIFNGNVSTSTGLIDVPSGYTVSGIGSLQTVTLEEGAILDLSLGLTVQGIWNYGGTILCPTGETWNGSECSL